MSIDAIYQDEVDKFLRGLNVSLRVIQDIWGKEKTFPAPDRLLPLIVKYKKPSSNGRDVLIKLASFFSQKDKKTSSFSRMDFMLGLADLYAKEVSAETYIVDFDINNCKGAGKWLGFERMIAIFKLVNDTFLSSLREHGADFAFSFDNAKNDDFRIITGGIGKDKLEEALNTAQKELDHMLVFAIDLPHSKYDDKYGLGVGYGYLALGNGDSIEAIEKNLCLYQEKTKRLSFECRKKILLTHTDRKRLPPEIVCLLSDEILEKNVEEESNFNEFFVVQELCNKKVIQNDVCSARKKRWMQIAAINNFSEHDRDILSNIIDFYHLQDGLTGALSDKFLLSDIKYIAKRDSAPVTIINLKLENCAGINKILSKMHSVAMTRDFVNRIKEYLALDTIGSNGAWIYYIGRNSFNILIPKLLSDSESSLLENSLSDFIDTQINKKTIKSYFSEIGIEIPTSFDGVNLKMSEIPNLRGNRDGIQIINYASVSLSGNVSLSDLILFQRNISGIPQSIRRDVNECSLTSLGLDLFDNTQIPNINSLYKKLRLRFPS